MPELPEVETVVSGIKPLLKGRVFSGISGNVKQAVAPSFKDFERIKNKRVVDIKRRGKFINIWLEDEFIITLHLRMSGRLIAKKPEDEFLPFERTRLDFEEVSLRFCDIRKFGRVWLNKVEDYEKNTGIYKLGPEPLEKEFSLDYFERIIKKDRNLKALLLDQSLIAGIGNIYADESLFYAGLKPTRKGRSLKSNELEALFNSVKKALTQGIRNRGTSISDFQDAYGKSGKNQELLFVYGRGGKPCLKCEDVLQKQVVAGRGTVFCKNCQT